MTEEERLNRLFSLMVDVKWTNSERYRNGIIGILKECETAEEFEVVEHVLSGLLYCTSSDLDAAASNAANVIQQVWGLDPSNAILVGLAEPNKTCGSTAYVRAIETKLPRSWSDDIHTNFASSFRHREGKKNLVIVDDFIGSGEKILTRIKRIIENPKTSDYVIHVIAFAGMNFGVGEIAKVIENRIRTGKTLNKCISETQPSDKAGRLLDKMQSLEAKIFNKPNCYSFGYKQSEAAFFLEAANIPNNNFPILWWDKYADESERATLFTRR